MMRFAPVTCAISATWHRYGGWLLTAACLWCLVAGATTSAAAERRAGGAIEIGDRPVLGAPTAAIQVVEISNFKCSQCRSFHEKVFPTLRKDYIEAGKIQWVVVNASDDESEQYGKIFSLARCAQRQGKYWDLLDGLFAVAHRAPSVLEELVAKSPLIDRAALEICLKDRSVRSAVANDFADAARLKIRGTPTFVISKTGADGQRTEVTIAGAQSLDYFRRAFDALLSKP
jgi:protein-disulfide isomerase